MLMRRAPPGFDGGFRNGDGAAPKDRAVDMRLRRGSAYSQVRPFTLVRRVQVRSPLPAGTPFGRLLFDW